MEALVGKRIRPLTAFSTDLAENGPDRFPAPNDGVHTLKQLFESVRKYRRLVITLTVMGPMLAAALGFLMAPSYLATAQLAVDVQSSAHDANGASATASPSAEESIIDTHVTVLLSDAYLRGLLPTFRALDDASHRAGTALPTWVQSFRTLLDDTWSATKALILFKKRGPSDGDALSALKRGLKVGQERRSRIISVSFTDSDPRRAAEIANVIAQSYVDEIAHQRQSEVEQALNSLAAQSSKTQDNLAKAEEELRTYRPGQASASRDGLEWRVTTLAQQFEMLLRRRQELTAKILVVRSDVSLLAVASPPDRPASLHPLLIVPPAAILFAVLGCVLAVVLNGLDRTLHSEADAMDALRIPCVGLVPAIPPEQIKQLQNVLGQPASPYARALRSILVSILAADPTSLRSQQIILVSSSIGGEGKTALAWSLALCAARLGRRTLLLDFGEFSGRRGHERGSLLNMLTHDRPLAEVVGPIPDFGIDYLPAGLSDGNRLRILANPKISPLLRQLSGAYDFVIIDGPSLLEAPEAKLLASRADHVLFAVHCGSTSREIAQTALHQLAPVDHLDPVRDTRLSSVLTRADPSQHDQFGRRAERLLRRVWSRQPAVKGSNETEGGWTAAIAVKGSGAPNQKSG